jgi:hypothetical protein
MELLGKWTKIIPKPDFKALQKSPESAAETLTRVITEQNAFLIAKLLQKYVVVLLTSAILTLLLKR